MVLKTVSNAGGGASNGTVTQVNTGTGLTGGPITTTGTISIANTTVTQGVYGGPGNLVSIVITPTGQINSASNVALSLSNTSVVAGAYGNSTAVSTFTVLADGRLNSASNVLIANIVLGNAQLQVGQTTTSVGNLTLNAPVINNPTGNVVPAIPAASIPNSLLANSSVTLGNTSLALGSTTATVGNVTLLNTTIGSGYINSMTANVNLATQTLLTANTTTVLQAGYPFNAAALGQISSYTVNPNLGNYQWGFNNVAFTMTAPNIDCAVDTLITNNSAAGSITLSGFTANATNSGDTYATTNTNKYILSVRRINGTSTYIWKALQ